MMGAISAVIEQGVPMGGRFERFLICAMAVVFALLLFGWFLAPSVIPFAPVIALVAYATIARLGVPVMRRSDPRTLTIAAWCGTVAAVIFVPSILIEYAGRTVDNALMYGAVFFVWFLAGVLAARLTGQVTDAVLATTVSAMISSLVFITTLLASYYLLRGSALQETFFRTEG